MSAPGFAGKAALVAGGAEGIGLACCRALLAGGAGLVFCGAAEEDVQAAAAELEGLGDGPVAGYLTDLADAAAVGRLVAETLRLFGRLDVCVAAAGSPSDVAPPRRDGVERRIVAGALGVHTLLAAVGPVMQDQGGGSIVTVGSVSGMRAVSDGGSEGPGKAAVHLLTKVFARDLAPHGVRVNCVAPGWVGAGANEGAEADGAPADAASVPLGRPARVEEVAEVVAFLAGDEAAAVSGAVVAVDGGLSCR